MWWEYKSWSKYGIKISIQFLGWDFENTAQYESVFVTNTHLHIVTNVLMTVCEQVPECALN